MLQYSIKKCKILTMDKDSLREQQFKKLQEEIEKAKLEKRPFEHLIIQQIQILKDVHKEFISKALAEGYSLKHPRLGEIEVRQFTEMKVLAKKANLPTNEYDELIKQVKIRVFGEENYENFFGNK